MSSEEVPIQSNPEYIASLTATANAVSLRADENASALMDGVSITHGQSDFSNWNSESADRNNYVGQLDVRNQTASIPRNKFVPQSVDTQNELCRLFQNMMSTNQLGRIWAANENTPGAVNAHDNAVGSRTMPYPPVFNGVEGMPSKCGSTDKLADPASDAIHGSACNGLTNGENLNGLTSAPSDNSTGTIPNFDFSSIWGPSDSRVWGSPTLRTESSINLANDDTVDDSDQDVLLRQGSVESDLRPTWAWPSRGDMSGSSPWHLMYPDGKDPEANNPQSYNLQRSIGGAGSVSDLISTANRSDLWPAPSFDPSLNNPTQTGIFPAQSEGMVVCNEMVSAVPFNQSNRRPNGASVYGSQSLLPADGNLTPISSSLMMDNAQTKTTSAYEGGPQQQQYFFSSHQNAVSLGQPPMGHMSSAPIQYASAPQYTYDPQSGGFSTANDQQQEYAYPAHHYQTGMGGMDESYPKSSIYTPPPGLTNLLMMASSAPGTSSSVVDPADAVAASYAAAAAAAAQSATNSAGVPSYTSHLQHQQQNSPMMNHQSANYAAVANGTGAGGQQQVMPYMIPQNAANFNPMALSMLLQLTSSTTPTSSPGNAIAGATAPGSNSNGFDSARLALLFQAQQFLAAATGQPPPNSSSTGAPFEVNAGMPPPPTAPPPHLLPNHQQQFVPLPKPVPGGAQTNNLLSVPPHDGGAGGKHQSPQMTMTTEFASQLAAAYAAGLLHQQHRSGAPPPTGAPPSYPPPPSHNAPPSGYYAYDKPASGHYCCGSSSNGAASVSSNPPPPPPGLGKSSSCAYCSPSLDANSRAVLLNAAVAAAAAAASSPFLSTPPPAPPPPSVLMQQQHYRPPPGPAVGGNTSNSNCSGIGGNGLVPVGRSAITGRPNSVAGMSVNSHSSPPSQGASTVGIPPPPVVVPIGLPDDPFSQGPTSVSQQQTNSSSTRSALLEGFRNSAARLQHISLGELRDHIVEFARDQYGSRFIQQRLETASEVDKEAVFDEILPHASNLMTDVFGNYVIQKFFEFGTSDQKERLAQNLQGRVVDFAMQMYGCRVIQKALESVPPEAKIRIVSELRPCVIRCVKDQNGNHVIQKCIECVTPKELDFIINAFRGQVVALSSHPYGCRVIQRILEHCIDEQTRPVLDELHDGIEHLAKDQYGNYVIQHVLERGQPADKSLIIQGLRGHVAVFSAHKFASNVMERAIAHSEPRDRAILIDEIIHPINSTGVLDEAGSVTVSNSSLLDMMKDQYANYVIQRILELADSEQRRLLFNRIRVMQHTLRKYTYGKHIVARYEKYVNSLNNNNTAVQPQQNGSAAGSVVLAVSTADIASTTSTLSKIPVGVSGSSTLNGKSNGSNVDPVKPVNGSNGAPKV